MAGISAKSDVTVMKIGTFLGLNENPDGETTLKVGELSRMRNFRITQDGHLQKRPGTKELLKINTVEYWKKEIPVVTKAQAAAAQSGDDGETPEVPPGWEEGGDNPVTWEPTPDKVTKEIPHLFGLWRGMVSGKEHVLANYDGVIYDIDLTGEEAKATRIGNAAFASTSFFPFGGKVYLLDGTSYKVWDGGEDGFQDVEGYIPLIQTATAPGGDGTLLENVNRLNGFRRVEFSPDGRATKFQLPEKDVDEFVAVTLEGAAATYKQIDLAEGTVTFATAPKEGVNTLSVTYKKGNGARSEVTGMRFAELFNGNTDTRVFLYGNGSNKAIYSGVEYESGQPSAEYFPDLYEVAVGEVNTPITALVRYYSRLMAYKPGSAWVIAPGSLTLDSGITEAAFYVSPVNRQLGNDAMGQVKLLENDPLTMDAGSVYQWRSSTGYISNSENNAKRISDRVAATLRDFDVSLLKTYNGKRDHEFWFLYGHDALILNYTNDTWYYYKDLPFNEIVELGGEVYGFGNDGRIVRFSAEYRNDCGEPINCYAETGAMDFGRDWQYKYSPMVFVALRPDTHARIYVTAESNRRSDYPDKLVSATLSTFDHVDFAHFSFVTNRKPQVRRLRLKVKKAAFYRLIFKSFDRSATATVIETDVRLRYAGTVR